MSESKTKSPKVMNSFYKKYLLRTDLVFQVIFLVFVIVGYVIGFLGAEVFGFHIGGLMVLPLMLLFLLGFYNPISNALHLFLGSYSSETKVLRKNYLIAVGGYVALGLVSYPILSYFEGDLMEGFLGLYIFGLSHIFAAVYAYITVLENRAKALMDKRIFY